MPITVKNNTRLAELGSSLRDRIRQELRDALPGMRDRIRQRTLSGQDANNRAFEPYNTDYRRFKDREAIFGGSPVNLALTGDMLNSLDVEVSSSGPVTAKIQVTGGFNRDKARFNSNRRFMGLDRAQRTELARRIRNAIAGVRRR